MNINLDASILLYIIKKNYSWIVEVDTTTVENSSRDLREYLTRKGIVYKLLINVICERLIRSYYQTITTISK